LQLLFIVVVLSLHILNLFIYLLLFLYFTWLTLPATYVVTIVSIASSTFLHYQKYKGWSVKGLERYNELSFMVKNNRKSIHCLEWEESFCEKKEEEVALESLNKKRKAKDDNNKINKLQIYHDLWEEESEEDEDKKMSPGKQILGTDNW